MVYRVKIGVILGIVIGYIRYIGFRVSIPIMENQMEKKLENDMEARV